MRRLRGALAVSLLVVSCAGCSENAGEAKPPNLPESSTMTQSSPSSPVPSARAKYSAAQRAALTDAVDALHRFTRINDRFLKQGVLTKRQAAFYRKNSTNWVDDWANLSKLVNSRITFKGSSTEVWLRPLSIKLAARNGQRVSVRRCLDESRLRVFADGKEVAQPQLKNPHVYEVSMAKRSGESWWRVGLPQQGETC
jgi:hypothetical protein